MVPTGTLPSSPATGPAPRGSTSTAGWRARPPPLTAGTRSRHPRCSATGCARSCSPTGNRSSPTTTVRVCPHPAWCGCSGCSATRHRSSMRHGRPNTSSPATQRRHRATSRPVPGPPTGSSTRTASRPRPRQETWSSTLARLIDRRAGHIPGAINLPFEGNLAAGRFRSADELAARFAEVGDAPIVYCGSGVSACHNLLAMESIGVRARLYPGSWSQWSADPSRDTASGET